MTIAITNTATIIGIDAHVIEVEADVSIGLGHFSTVGLPDGAIKEVVSHFQNEQPLPEYIAYLEETLHPTGADSLDFSDVRGQETAKRAEFMNKDSLACRHSVLDTLNSRDS